MSDEPKDDDGLEEVDGIELDEGDAALVLRKDGRIQHVVSNLKDGDEVFEGSPEMQIAVLLYVLTDENRYRALEDEFLQFAGLKREPVILH